MPANPGTSAPMDKCERLIRLMIAIATCLLLASCSEQNGTNEDAKEHFATPYETEPLSNAEVEKLWKLLPRNWENPTRAESPAGNYERLLFAMTGKLRGIYQTARLEDGQMDNATRLSTAFMDTSGRYLIGKDSTTESSDDQETTYYVIYYEPKENLYRGVSWTHGVLGKEKPKQMVGQHVQSKLVIRWKAYDPGRYAGNTSVLEIKNSNEFIWTVTLYKESKEHSKLINTSILSKSWPKNQ